MPKVLFLLFYLFLATFTAPAQHVINVMDEPFHKPVFESTEYTVIHLQMEKGDTSMFHLHNKPILYLTITGAEMWLKEPHQKAQTVELPNGWIGSNFYSADSAFIHKIAVADGGPLNLIGIIRNTELSFKSDSIFKSSLYSENGFIVNIDSVLNNRGSCILNVVKRGTAVSSQKTLSVGNTFHEQTKLTKPSSNFQYYSIAFY